MTDIPRIDIPEDIMKQIQQNAENKMARYLGELIVPGMVAKFYSTDIRLYLFDESRDPSTPPKQDKPKNVSEIPETIISQNEQYRLVMNMDRVAAKTFAKGIKGFSITPFNI